jgi:carboxyl-terminal processing protease
MKKWKFWTLVIFVLWSALIISGFALSKSKDEVYRKLKQFTEIMEIVRKEYVEEVDYDRLIIGAIQGMLQSLDPYSSYLTPDMMKEMEIETKGTFGGIGIEIGIKDGILTVISPIEDTPAWKAGLKAGDKILKINGEPTKGLSLMECVKRLRGPKGTKVTITILREGFSEPKDFTIVRDIIKIESVKSKELEPGYLYLRVTQFQEDTTKDLREAIVAYNKKTPIKGLILDLRNNPGGLLDQAVGVADLFLKEGVIVSVKTRGGQELVYQAQQEGTFPEWPLVVLVNHGSASASEIVAGALKVHHRGIILGTRTFGKGSVQTIIPLEGGAGLRLTTARYFTPDENSIQDKGINPDIVLEEEETSEKEDSLLKKALEYLKVLSIYGNYLKAKNH